MRVNIEIPDELVQQAQAAATRINERRAAEQRTPAPMVLNNAEVALIVINYLSGLVLSDFNEDQQLAAKVNAGKLQDQLARFRLAPESE